MPPLQRCDRQFIFAAEEHPDCGVELPLRSRDLAYLHGTFGISHDTLTPKNGKRTKAVKTPVKNCN